MVLWFEEGDFSANELTVAGGTSEMIEGLHLTGDFGNSVIGICADFVCILGMVAGATREVATGKYGFGAFTAWRETAQHLRGCFCGRGEGLIAGFGKG